MRSILQNLFQKLDSGAWRNRTHSGSGTCNQLARTVIACCAPISQPLYFQTPPDTEFGPFLMLDARPSIITKLLYAVIVVLPIALIVCSSEAIAQNEEDFVPLYNGESLDGWIVENATGGNFFVKDGILHVEEPEGWLRTERMYADFRLHVEFRFLGDVADSGIFFRVAGENTFGRGWPDRSYQVQTIDVSTDRTTRFKFIGDIYRHGMPEGVTRYDTDMALAAIRPTGAWQSFDIQVVADSVTVMLNGTLVTRAGNIGNTTGYIGLQGETSIVEYRAIEIQEIP